MLDAAVQSLRAGIGDTMLEVSQDPRQVVAEHIRHFDQEAIPGLDRSLEPGDEEDLALLYCLAGEEVTEALFEGPYAGRLQVRLAQLLEDLPLRGGEVLFLLQPIVASSCQWVVFPFPQGAALRSPGLIHSRSQVHGQVEEIMHDIGLGDDPVAGVEESLPHVHRHRADTLALLEAQAVPQELLRTLAGATLDDLQDAILALISQHRDVAVPLLDGFLIEGQLGPELLGIPAVHPSYHCPLHQVMHLSGRETEDLGRFVLDLGGQQEVNGEAFEKEGEARASFAPGRIHGLGPVLGTDHPGQGGDEQGLVLAGVQVAPGPILAMVIDRSNILADGASPVRGIAMVRELDADFSSFQVQLYMLYIPGGFDAQDLTVEFNVSHSSDDRRFAGRTQDNPQGHKRQKFRRVLCFINQDRRRIFLHEQGRISFC